MASSTIPQNIRVKPVEFPDNGAVTEGSLMVPESQTDARPAIRDLSLAFARLEAEYRLFREAAERYYARAECGLEAPPARSIPGHGMEREILTNRETQLLKLISAGKSTKQAAAELGIAFKTAVGHRTTLMRKLNIHDTATLVRYAIRIRLVEP